MKIKNKFSFFAGIFCLGCFITAIVHHRDSFVLIFTGCSALINILFGLFDE